MTQLLVKLLMAPAFVVGASLIARRFGPRIGGLVSGLPVVAGPILLVYALAHGRHFAAGAASGTLLGLVSLIAFVVVYAHLAGRLSWLASMLSGWLAFALCTVLFSAFAVPLGVALCLALGAVAGALPLMPEAGEATLSATKPPGWDLPLRAGCAMALVLTLTLIAGWLGPQLSGLLAPFPIITTVLATFTHAQRGVDETRRLLRGLLAGLAAYALFCFSLSLALHDLDTAAAFSLATLVALITQGLAIALVRHERDLAVAEAGPTPLSLSSPPR